MTDATSQRPLTGLLTTQDVADLFRVDVATVRRWARNGSLPCVRTPGGGRIRFEAGVIVKRLGESYRADVLARASA